MKIFQKSCLVLFAFVVCCFFTNIVYADQKVRINSKVRGAIVKIYAVYSYPDYFSPWKIVGPESGGGSGCIIKGNRILTNAHVVADASFIQVRRYGDAQRYNARVLNVSHDADLALLTVDDKDFFKGVTPLEFGGLPDTQQEVLVYGFPLGGDSLSITKGVISRIEHQRYVHSSSYFLAGQIDAAINSGNSGGPVIEGDKIVGVVMQNYNPGVSENIGYMVPMPVIRHFFKDIKDGKYEGFPEIGLLTQRMESPDMKRKYNMPEDMTGVLINKVLLGSPAEDKMEEGDVLLSVDGHNIADDGTVEFRDEERTNYAYCVDAHQLGEKITFNILREGKVKKLSFVLKSTQDKFWLVAREQYDRSPTYFIYGGIVFTPLTKNLIREWGPNWIEEAPIEFLVELSDWPSEEKKEVVVALKVLAADMNKGYHNFRNAIITEVNGEKFKDFREFFDIVMNAPGPFIEFKEKRDYDIVIDCQKAKDQNQAILDIYRIAEDRSPDLK